MPQLPNDTRWNSHVDCVKSFTTNYHKYREIALEHNKDFHANISNILNNVGLYNEAVHLEKQLCLIANALDKFQKETTMISDAVGIWVDLLSSDVLKPYHPHLNKRFQQAIQPSHILANLMDPKYRGQNLSDDQERSTEMWLTEHHPEYLPGVMAFTINDPTYYPDSMMQANVIQEFTSQKWWQIMEKKVKKTPSLLLGFVTFSSVYIQLQLLLVQSRGFSPHLD